MMKKVLKMNTGGSIGITLSIKFARELVIDDESFVNIEKVGNCLHVTKIKID